jgi:myo-inositol-1(or 4)-monophosphatase
LPDPSDQDDLTLLDAAVREAGKIALGFFGGDYKSWSKAGGSPVTEADLAVDSFLKAILLAARPDYGWLSEEGTDNTERLEKKRVFVVDPIDGTVAFLKGRPHFAICAAVVEAGRPRAGVVFNPATGECFTAVKGGGAFLNGAPIHPGDCAVIEDCRMLAPKSLFQDWPPMQIESYSSIAYRIALVAAGRHDAMVSLTTKRDWDLAAADLLIWEAGGKLTGAEGPPLLYNQAAAAQRATIAAGPRLHAALLACISPDATKITWKTGPDSP